LEARRVKSRGCKNIEKWNIDKSPRDKVNFPKEKLHEID
jgi:hypothetical protein